MTDKIRLHAILDIKSSAILDEIKALENVEIAQWDFSYDSAFQWTLHNEDEKIDVFLASEFAQVSMTGGDNKVIPWDTALLRIIKELRVMRPQAKFVLLCDEKRDLPENRHFLGNLVALGIYDFEIFTKVNEESLRVMIEGPKRDITHVQNYLPENVGTAKPFALKSVTVAKKEPKAVDIFAMIRRWGAEGAKERKEPKIRHITEKTRQARVSFLPVGSAEGNSSLLAAYFASKLAQRGAKVALTEFHNSGIPRLGYSTGIKSRVKTIEAALQRIEDGESVLGMYITPKEAATLTPAYDSAITEKIKSYPETLHILGGRDNIMPNIHPFKGVKGSTLDAAPGKIVSEIIGQHEFDCVVFDLNGGLSLKLVFHSLKESSRIHCVVDQHPAHISWLRQNLTLMEKAGIPLKNIRIIVYPYYELPNIRKADIEAALGVDVDYALPDVTKDLFNLAWGKGEVKNEEFNTLIAEMIRDSTGYKLGELEKKGARRFKMPAILFKKKEAAADGQPSGS